MSRIGRSSSTLTPSTPTAQATLLRLPATSRSSTVLLRLVCTCKIILAESKTITNRPSSFTATAGSSKRDAMPEPIAAAEALPTVVPSLTAHNLSNPLHGIGSALTAANGSTYEYVANIQTPRYALAGSYVVFLFLGQPASEDPTTWLTDANLVGPMGVLSQDNMQGATVIAAGSIPLTRSLTAKLGSGPLAELTEALVGPFLKSMLSWRIAGPDGSAVDPNSVAGFKVSVYASTASDTSDMPHVLPKWSPFIPIPVATHGKPGGHPGFISPEDC